MIENLFYKGEFAGIAAEGTGELMKKIVEKSCKKYTKIRLNSKIIGLKTYKNKITKIKILEKGVKENYISVGENDLVVNTLPINLISEMLGKKI